MSERRPYVPLAVKVAVSKKLVRSLGGVPSTTISVTLTAQLKFNLNLAARLNGLSDGDSWQLDHNPSLAARKQHKRWDGSRMAIYYDPPANDPDHLFYIPADDHRTKTYIRGPHGQYSDIALIKRERRRLRKKQGPKTKSKFWKSDPKRSAKPKRQWPSRPFPKRRKQ